MPFRRSYSKAFNVRQRYFCPLNLVSIRFRCTDFTIALPNYYAYVVDDRVLLFSRLVFGDDSFEALALDIQIADGLQ